jgi:GNAT superfamily N-acetyltransferase
LAKPAQQYVGIMDGTLVCHTGVIQAPLRKGFKQVHRLVVLPDYQGIGIGTKFITFIADNYEKQGLIMKLITTTPAIRFSLDKSPKWTLTRSGYVQSAGNTTYMKHWTNSQSSNRVTYTYVYNSDDHLEEIVC